MALRDHGLVGHLAKFRWTAVTTRSLAYSLPPSSPHSVGDIGPTPTSKAKVSRIVYSDEPHEYFFLFDGYGHHFMVHYFPDDRLGVQRQICESWSQVMTHVQKWSEAVANEIRAPDLWASPEAAAADVFGVSFDDTEEGAPFTDPELAAIQERAKVLRVRLIAQHDLSPEQQSEIDAKLDHLLVQARKQSRGAWRNTLIGVLVSIASIINPQLGLAAGAAALMSAFVALRQEPALSERDSF